MRKRSFGERFCKKKSKKRAAWEHRRASVLQIGASEDQNKKESGTAQLFVVVN